MNDHTKINNGTKVYAHDLSKYDKGPRYPHCPTDPKHGCRDCRTFDVMLLARIVRTLEAMPAPVVVMDKTSGASKAFHVVPAEQVELWQQHLRVVAEHLVPNCWPDPEFGCIVA